MTIAVDHTASRADDLWGKGFDAMYPIDPYAAKDWRGNPSRVSSAPMPWPWRRYRLNTPGMYDRDAVAKAMADPVFEEFDPRTLSASQGGLTREGVAYYMDHDNWERGGETYADKDLPSNQYPVVYIEPDGTPVILVGHHRFAAALLKGKKLRAIRAESPEYARAHHAHAVPRRASARGGRAEGGDGRGGRAGDRGRVDGGAARGSLQGRGVSSNSTRGEGLAAEGGQREAVYGPDLIARGLHVYVGIDAHDEMVPALLAGTVTARDVLRLLDPDVGVWWGIMGTFGDLVDFEDYAYTDDLLADTYADLDGGEVSVVLIAKRPTRNGQPWDPEVHNPQEVGGLMGNSYLLNHESVELVEIRYNAGKGWRSLPASGIRVQATRMAGPIYRGMCLRLNPEQVQMRRDEQWVPLANSVARQITAQGASHGWHDGGVSTALGMYWSHSLEVANRFAGTPSRDDLLSVVVEARYDETAEPGKPTGYGFWGQEEQEQTLAPGTRVEIDALRLRDARGNWFRVTMNGLQATAKVRPLPDVWYHGASERRAKEVSQIGFPADYNPTNGQYGPGVYLTTSPKTANLYGDMVTRSGRPGAMMSLRATFAHPYVSNDGAVVDNVNRQFGTHLSDGKQVNEFLRSKGYDALVIHFINETWAIVFDPTSLSYAGHIPSVDRKEFKGMVASKTAAAPDPVALEHWRPSAGMFAPGMKTLDPRIFDLTTEQMLPSVRESVLGHLVAYWTPLFGHWRDWARVYLAGSGASYWWDSDTDLDLMVGVDLDRLRSARPANKDVPDDEIIAHLNKTLMDLRPSMAAMVFEPGTKPMDVTYFVNPGSYDINAIHPYAAYSLDDDCWVVHPPILPANWGPDSIPDDTWRRCEQAAREAEEVLSLPEPDRTAAGIALFDWIHEGRRAAYSANGGGWLDPGNVIYQYLSQHPLHLLRRLYLAKHPEAATAADAIEKTAARTIRYAHNPERAGHHGSTYGQDIEPAGRYLVDITAGGQVPLGWESGTVTFANPLDIPFGGGYGEPSNWKRVLSDRYGGKTGAALSRAVLADGHDGIITHDDYGTSEIVDLTGLGHEGGSKTAAVPGLEIEEEWDLPSLNPGERAVTARINGKLVGGLIWQASDGIINYVQVDPDMRRKGVATALLAKARSLDPNVHHDVEKNRSDLGKAWVKAVGSKTAATLPDVWYHAASDRRIEEVTREGHFPADYSPTRASYGRGVYLSSAEPNAYSGFGSASVAVHPGWRNPWVIANEGDPSPPFEPWDFWHLLPQQIRQGFKDRMNHITTPNEEGEVLRDLLMREGYDACVWWHKNEWWAVAYHPEQVRPIKTAKTAGQYDPVEREVTLDGQKFVLSFDPIRTPWWRSIRATVGTTKGSEAGYLTWGFNNTIGDVGVQKRWQRRGLATAMLEFAREIVPDLKHSHALTDDGKAWSQAVGAKTAATGGTIWRGLRLPVTDEVRELAKSYWDEAEVPERRSAKIGQIFLNMMEKHTGRHSGPGLGIHWSTRPEMADVAAETSGQRQDWPVVVEATYRPEDVVPEGDDLYGLSGVWQGNGIEAEVLIKPGARLTVTGLWLAEQFAGTNIFSVDDCPKMNIRGTNYRNVLPSPQQRTAMANDFDHDGDEDAIGPLWQRWHGYSPQTQQRIINTIEDVQSGRKRPEPKQRGLRGYYSVDLDGRTEPERLLFAPVNGQWDAVMFLKQHQYAEAERVLPGWERSTDYRRYFASAAPAGEARLVILDKTDPEAAAAQLAEHLDTVEQPEQEQQHEALIYPQRRRTLGTWDRDLMHSITKDHGFTMHDHIGDAPTNGFMVSIDKDSEQTIPITDISPQTVSDYMSVHQQELRDPNNFLGGWVYKGNVFLDISRHVPDQEQAVRLAKANHQLGIYDLGSGQTIMTS